MIFLTIFAMVGFFWSATVWINYWLPNYIPQKSLWWIDFIYRVVRAVSFILIFNTLNLSLALIWILWLIWMYFVKQYVWSLAYKDYL